MFRISLWIPVTLYICFLLILSNLKDLLGNTAVQITNGANPALINNSQQKPIDVAMPSVTEVLQLEEEGADPVRCGLDYRTKLKDGDLAMVKVRSYGDDVLWNQ